MSREEPEDPVADRLRADAAQCGGAPDDLWARIDEDLTREGIRETVIAWSTPARRALGVGLVGLLCVLLVAVQGVRSDLSSGEWVHFAIDAGPLVLTGLAATVFALGHRGVTWRMPGLVIAAAWLVMLASSVLADWPGVTGVPTKMDVYCFAMTSLLTVAAMLGLSWLDRAERPVVWRVGAAAAGAGLVAFVAQGVFCPGVDVDHMILGHGGASVVWAVAGMLGALALARAKRSDT